MAAPVSENNTKRPLLASYGGGHAQIIARLATGLMERGVTPHVLGLTTAFQHFNRSGLDALSVTAVLDADPATYEAYFPIVAPFLPKQQHPDMTADETHAYFAIGFGDLVELHGLDLALDMLRKDGRKAFQPVRAMEQFLQKMQPSCVVATTSPRFELALLQAARRLGIPSLAVSDLFLINEREWILAGGYADHLTVIAEPLKQDLLAQGLRTTQITVTGNPVFDTLSPKPDDAARRLQLRADMGIGDRKVILWPSAPVTKIEQYDRPFATPADVAKAFEPLCEDDPSFVYLLRPHPNAPYTLPAGAKHGILDVSLTPLDALLVADLVCVELSTMGLQAALRGLPVVCVGFAEQAIYPRYGFADVAVTLDDAVALIKKGTYNRHHSQSLNMPALGQSTGLVLDLIQEIVSPH